MATTSIILQLLKFYSSRQRAPVIDYGEFVDYVRKYAQHHFDENPELANFINGPVSDIQAELDRYASDRQIAITGVGKQVIYVLAFFIDRYTESYTDIAKNFSVSFPCVTDIQKTVPSDLITSVSASDIISQLLEKQVIDERTLYSIAFTKQVPSLLLPSTVSISVLINAALKKLQDFMRKEESHDYFLKKLTNSNPGKEIAIKNFFTQFVAKPEESLDALRHNGDSFYYWNQLFYFIKQDYNKVKDFTSEDINLLQSIGIIEVAANYYKSKASERIQKDAAFKVLDELLLQPPYYFTMDQVQKMKDNHGQYLLGKYKEDDLKEHLEGLTSETIGDTLPKLLIFRTEDGQGYFIFKEKVMPLIVRLCNDARDLIRESLSKAWFKYLRQFEVLSEMKENHSFENALERELRVVQPILYAILHASFLPVLAYDDQTPGRITLYRDGLLISYSELLLINRQEIYNDAKVKLPFWYSIPLVSWLISLVVRKPKKERVKDSKKSAAEKMLREEKDKADAKVRELDDKDLGDPLKNKKRILRREASEAEKILVPENSTLDRELESYLSEWNDRLAAKPRENLTQDVNNLIRDYTRKTLKTFKTENLSVDRVDSLAQSLVESPALYKVKNHPALKRYIELYIIKLIKNLP